MKKIIATTKAPGAIGPYSQATTNGKMVFVSGQLPIDMSSGEFAMGIQAQTKASLENMKQILQASGCTLDNVLKTTVFLSDMNNFAEMNAVYAEYFVQDAPARSTVEVARLPKDALVEIECVAWKN